MNIPATKSINKHMLMMGLIGAATGFLILSPLAIYLSYFSHNNVAANPLSLGQVISIKSWPWFFFFVVLGLTMGLIVGYFYNDNRKSKKDFDELKNYLNLVINNVGGRIMLVDQDYKIIFCNKSYGGNTATNPDDLSGEYCYTIRHKNEKPCHGDGGECLVQQTFKSGGPYVAVSRSTDADPPVDVEKKTFPLKDSDGNIISCLVISNDIPVQPEESVQQAQKIEAIGTLAGGIAHDFNNILGVIIGYADLALFNTPIGSKLYGYLQSIIKAGKRGQDLTGQILAFSRKQSVHKQPVLVADIINDILKLLRASLPTTIAIQPEISATNARIMADSTQIHQILMNLCTNAGYAMREKGGLLGIRLKEIDLNHETAKNMTVLPPGRYLSLSVSDNGHGIEPSIIPKIFDPFFTTKKKGEGTGMGLAVVHGIVKSYGGDIIVKSKIESGTVFHILFPLLKDEFPESDDPDKISVEFTRGDGKVMLVDDEKELTKTGKEMLELLGYKVQAVSSSIRALEMFNNQPDLYDLIITDHTMPEKTGYEMAKEMLRIRPDLPIIITTGFTESITPGDAFNIGIKDFLLKPFDIKQLSETIKRATTPVQ